MSGVKGMGPAGDDGLVPRNWFAITPSDTTDAAHDLSNTDNANVANKGLYVAVAGNLTFQTVDASAAVGPIAVTAGQYIYGQIKYVKATTTTATVLGMGG